MKTITTGWVFIQPNGNVITDNLHIADFNRAQLPNTPARQLEIMQRLQMDFYPDCELMRVRIIPFNEKDN